MSLGSRVYKLTFDSNADKSIKPTRREMALLRQIMEDSTPPAEKYRQQMLNLQRVFVKSDMTIDQLTHAMERLHAEQPKAIRHAELEANAEKKRTEAFRQGIAVTREMETVTERYQRELAQVERQIRRGGPHVDAYRRKLAQLKAEYAANTSQAGIFSKAVAGFSRIAGPLASLTGVAVGVGGIGMAARSAGRSYHEFTQEMARSTAIMTGVTEEQQERMRRVARDVSFDVEASAAQAAEGYFFLASAGLSAEESIAALPITAKFAQAGTFDLATATDLLTDAQSALGLNVGSTSDKMREMTRVGDVLTKANTIANASIEQFSTSLTNKAGAAIKMLNKDVEEGVAVLAAYADQGLKGEEAGTAFSIVMRDLTTKAIENEEAFGRLGIKVFDESDNMRRLADIIRDLDNRMAGLSDKAKKRMLLELGFSDKSLAFTQMLLGTSDKIDEYEAKLRNAAGAMDDVADNSMSALTKTLAKVTAGWDEFSEIVSTPIVASLLGTDGKELEKSIREFNANVAEAAPLLEDLGTGLVSIGDAAASSAGIVVELTTAVSDLNNEFSEITGTGIIEFWGNSIAFFAKGGLLGKGLRELGTAMGEATEVVEPSAKALEKLANSTGRLNGTARDAAESLVDLVGDTEAQAEAANKLEASIEAAEQALRDEITALLVGSDALERYKLRTEGATDAQLAAFDQLTHQRDALRAKADAEKEAAEAEEKAKKASADATASLKEEIADYIAELEKQIATQGMSADEVAVWELKQRGAGDEVLRTVAALQEEARAHKEVERAAQSSFSALVVGSRQAEEALARAQQAQIAEWWSDEAREKADRELFPGAGTDGSSLASPAPMVHPVAESPPDPRLDDHTKLLKSISRNTGRDPVTVREVTL